MLVRPFRSTTSSLISLSSLVVPPSSFMVHNGAHFGEFRERLRPLTFFYNGNSNVQCSCGLPLPLWQKLFPSFRDEFCLPDLFKVNLNNSLLFSLPFTDRTPLLFPGPWVSAQRLLSTSGGPLPSPVRTFPLFFEFAGSISSYLFDV